MWPGRITAGRVFALLTLFNRGILVISVKLLDVRINNHTLLGSSTTLTCIYDLEGETLYAVKWYKDGDEFFRYLPKNKPEIQVFEQRGIYIDIDKSNANDVVLNSLELSSSGTYRCEVSAEAPSFQTVFQDRDMVTMTMPDGSPRIDGLLSEYSTGDVVLANCTLNTTRSPHAQLVWYINEEKANLSVLHGPYFKYASAEEFLTTVLGLSFKVTSHQTDSSSVMHLKCAAHLASVYLQSDEQIVKFVKRWPAQSIIGDTGLKTSSLANKGTLLIQATSTGEHLVANAISLICTVLVIFFEKYCNNASFY
ncbi:uncharacterized protein LOC126835600 [Adelges cooleyi]|uniref:uncharacterized protein LOC126835600 n=1 Tax=Adelges cooleyi TaxID=133065 RepID=UPI00217FC28A|nr:uncharacterized protein LOC126835600 [Adelges cooleyi]